MAIEINVVKPREDREKSKVKRSSIYFSVLGKYRTSSW
jgi:hypothetical protein